MGKQINSLELQLTNKCQFNCSYCGNEPVISSDREINNKDIIKIINYLKPKKISFTGGEPLIMFERLIELIRVAKSNNVITQLNTNGELLNKDRIQKLNSEGLDIIHISLSTLDQPLYDSLRGIDGSNIIDQLITNIRHLTQTTNIQLIIESLLLKQNISQITDVYKFAMDNMAVTFEVQNLIPLSKKMWMNIPTNDEILSLFIKLSEISNRKCKVVVCCLHLTKCFGFPDIRSFNNFEYYGCMCGNSSYYLSSNGHVFPCSFFHYSLGNILKDDLKNIFENEVFDKMEKEIPTKCNTCDIFDLCRNTCISVAYSHSMDFKTHSYPVYQRNCT